MPEVLQDKYKILHEIGRGGMAVVYKGIDTALDRVVAVKVLHPHLAERKDSQIRFQREAKAVAKLHHKNILEIFDYSGLDSDESYIVTEYIRGETLKDFTVRSAPMLPEIGAMMCHEMSAALAHAHDAGIIHRDVKPENIMIRDDGVMKLMDFGIARILDMHAMTVTGALVGSPAHMAPEHVEGKELDYRADVFSLGTLLYFLCTGRLPFDSASPHALLRQILETTYDDPRIHNPAIGRQLHGIITKCLQQDPNDRYQTTEELQYELADYLAGLGLEEISEELAEYFEDPVVVEAQLTQRVVNTLMERAQKDAQSGHVANALESYNQVLSLEGDREDALAQIHKLSSARSRSELVRKIMISAAAITIIGAIVWPFAFPEPISVTTPDVSEHVAKIPKGVIVSKATAVTQRSNTRTVASNSVTRRSPEPEVTWAPKTPEITISRTMRPKKATAVKRRNTKDRDKKPANIQAAPTPRKVVQRGVRFKIHANPPAATVIFEGRKYPNGQTPFLVRPAGSYRVTVDYPDCQFCVRRTHRLTLNTKSPPRAPVTFPVGYEVATLIVNAIPNAAINADGRLSKPGRPITFKMRRKSRTVRVKVMAPGFKTKTTHISIQSGSTREIRVSLARSE